MRRGLALPLAALVLSFSPVLAGAGPPAAAAATPPTPPPGTAPPQAKAWMLVDTDTGAVVDAFNDHASLRPASVEKIVTGLLAVAALPPDATVPVGADAAGEEAAKINMKAGQAWTFQDALHSLLMVSANDAAVALADRVSGTTASFARLAQVVARHLGAVDNPVLNDPAGLDDSFALGGGDLISAWDLALMTRAAMTYPEFSGVVRLPIYDFVGPDGVHHVLRNHNKLLLTDPTLVGVKPGYTRQAGDTYVAEAQRNGRSMLVVELGVAPPTMYGGAEYLFGQGFATPVDAEPTADRLPPVRVPDVAALAASLQRSSASGLTPVPSGAAPASAASTRPVRAASGRSGGSGGSDVLRFFLVLVAAAVTWGVTRRRRARSVAGPAPVGVGPAAVRSGPAYIAAPEPSGVRPAAVRSEPVGIPRPEPPGGATPVPAAPHPMIPVPDYLPDSPEAAWEAAGAVWEAAGAVWEAAVPTCLVDWEEWEILGAPDGSPAQEARNRRAASIER